MISFSVCCFFVNVLISLKILHRIEMQISITKMIIIFRMSIQFNRGLFIGCEMMKWIKSISFAIYECIQVHLNNNPFFCLCNPHSNKSNQARIYSWIDKHTNKYNRDRDRGRQRRDFDWEDRASHISIVSKQNEAVEAAATAAAAYVAHVRTFDGNNNRGNYKIPFSTFRTVRCQRLINALTWAAKWPIKWPKKKYRAKGRISQPTW